MRSEPPPLCFSAPSAPRKPPAWPSSTVRRLGILTYPLYFTLQPYGLVDFTATGLPSRSAWTASAT